MSDEDLRITIMRSLAATGRAPSVPALAKMLTRDAEDVRDGLRRLAQARYLVLGSRDEIVMAHPFATSPLGFSVMGRGTLWWGGCAWDSFAVPHLVTDEPDVLVATRCPGCDAALAWVVGRDAPPEGAEVAHFLVPMAHVWDDVVHTCGHQRLFCSTACVDAWLVESRNPRGYVMDLATLWRLASGWYAGRLDPGYQRREPAQAAEYFRSVGLTGAFWGL